MRNKLHSYIKLIRLDKPVGILLLLWPTSWAIVMASSGKIDPYLTTIFFLGVICTRSLGCAINDLADRDIDSKVKRTLDRPLATGELEPINVLILIAILSMLSLALLLLLPVQTWKFAAAAALLMIIYPFCKRFISCPQLILGISFSCGILMAYSAILNNITNQAWFLFIISTLWSVIYDTQYALADIEYDKLIGVKSSAIYFGNHVNMILALLQLFFVFLWLSFGVIYQLTYNFFMFIILIIPCFYYQSKLISNKGEANKIKAFKNNQWIGAIILLALIIQNL